MMKNVIEIDGHKAVVSFDPDIQMFRGEFLDLTGGADFYADNVKDLEAEGRRSLETFLEVCAERGIEPTRKFSGKFVLRVPPKVHEAAALRAAAEGRSMDEWLAKTIEEAATA
ncbi:putative HicB family RNase H-like nuclease [Chelatococcus asaccharovorans]|nr:putative HicB family RNase H-like nuclease [Chelatococcus asaccharovorans]CAH1683771.1 putative HicB family RNase H-like nuclease [Chelatococcus asaccharovorans]